MEIGEALKWYPINPALSSEAVMATLLACLQRVILEGVPGDVVEMGCHAGDTSVFLARMIRELDGGRTLHLYDSFQGLPELDARDNPNWGEPGSVRTAEHVVHYRFEKEGLPPPRIHPGWFSELAEAEFPEQIAFAFFDGDLHSSILDSFACVYPRLSPRAIVCVHDYGCDTWPGVTAACDEFLDGKPERIERICYLLGAMTKMRRLCPPRGGVPSMMKAYVVVSHTADYLALQVRCLRAFSPEVAEVIVVNNGPEPENFEGIEGECARLGLRTIRGQGSRIGPGSSPVPSRTHGEALDLAWRLEGAAARAPIMILDMDCIPVARFNPLYWIAKHDIASYVKSGVGIRGQDILLPSPILTIIRNGLPNREAISWMPRDYDPDGYIDTGAGLAAWLLKHPQVRLASIPYRTMGVENFPPMFRDQAAATKARPMCLIADSLLHMQGGSGYCTAPAETEARKCLFLQYVNFRLQQRLGE